MIIIECVLRLWLAVAILAVLAVGAVVLVGAWVVSELSREARDVALLLRRVRC